MNANQKSLGMAVFDPAHRKAGGYWQWATVSLDIKWESVAGNVHKAWPIKLGNFEDQSGIYFGVLDEGAEGRWFYRVFPGGRDSFGRPGRYFFVLIQLQTPDQVLLPEVSEILNYFDTERGLPLNTTPLDGKIPGGKPSNQLLKLYRHWVSGEKEVHWGMDGSGTVFHFTPPISKSTVAPAPIILPSQPVIPQPIRGSYVTGFPVGLVIGVIIGFILGNAFNHKRDKVHGAYDTPTELTNFDNLQSQTTDKARKDANNVHNQKRPN